MGLLVPITLNVSDVFFTLEPSSSSSVVSVRQQGLQEELGDNREDITSGDDCPVEDNALVVDLSNFCGTLRIVTRAADRLTLGAPELIAAASSLGEAGERKVSQQQEPLLGSTPSLGSSSLDGIIASEAIVDADAVEENGEPVSAKNKNKGTVDPSSQISGTLATTARNGGFSSSTSLNIDSFAAEECARVSNAGSNHTSNSNEARVVSFSGTELSSTITSLDRRQGLFAKTDSQQKSTFNEMRALEEDGSILNSTAAMNSSGEIGVSTQLHIACARPRVSIDNLRTLLQAHPAAASNQDVFGRYPLHVFAENEALGTFAPIEETSSFVGDLVEINPRAVLKKDMEGNVPFIGAVTAWVEQIHHASEEEMSYQSFRGQFLTASEVNRFNAASPSARRFIYSFPRNVTVPRYVQWSLRMLSKAIDHVTPLPNASLLRSRTLSEVRLSMAKQTASVPFLYKALLLITNEDESNAIFNSSIMRPSLLCHEIIGYWLVAMIRANKPRAVKFLELVSSSTVEDLFGRKHGFTKEDTDTFCRKRRQLFEAVANLEGFVPSMLALNSNMIEQAASTRVVAYALDRAVKNPMSLGFMLFDLINQIILVLAYRIYVDGENAVPGVVKGCGALSIVISAYFLLREALTAISMIAYEHTMFKSYIADFWSLNDVVSMTLTFVTSACKFSGISIPVLFAFTIGFLWLKVLGTLKVLNIQLATFILALLEIVKEMRWFLLILLLAIIMFADMIEIISKNSGLCQEDSEVIEGRRRLDAQSDFCSPYLLDSYARIYALLVGDVTLEDFQQTGIITLLFVFFTFFGILILLSVLIAIVEDAYSRSKIKSFALFGRARVEYVARQQTREQFLRPVEDSSEGLRRRNHVTLLCRRMLRYCVVLLVGVVAATVGTLLGMTIHAVFYEWRAYGTLRYLDLTLVVVTVLFLASLLSLLAMTLKETHRRQCMRKNKLLHVFEKVAILPISLFCKFLGIDREEQGSLETFPSDDEWISKLHYIERRTQTMVDKLEDRFLAEMNNDIVASEGRIIAEGRRNAIELEEVLPDAERKCLQAGIAGKKGMHLPKAPTAEEDRAQHGTAWACALSTGRDGTGEGSSSDGDSGSATPHSPPATGLESSAVAYVEASPDNGIAVTGSELSAVSRVEASPDGGIAASMQPSSLPLARKRARGDGDSTVAVPNTICLDGASGDSQV